MSNDARAQGASARDPRIRAGGLLLVDKPAGVTSHDVVETIRKHVRPLKVGHTGTLDPTATGLLMLCVGEATKIAGFIETREKQYRATALLGVRTDTEDVAGEIIAQTAVDNLTEQSVRGAAKSFIGKIKQTPPAFSAVKVNGVRAYKRARQKQDVRLKPRTIEITRLEIESIEPPRIKFFVECSKGTYIRTLCGDLGGALNVGGCLESLRRLAIGHFRVADAAPLDALDSREKIFDALLPASEALSHMPVVRCNPEQVEKLSRGSALNAGDMIEPPEKEAWAQALGPDGELLAVGKLARDGGRLLFRPKRVLAIGSK